MKRFGWKKLLCIAVGIGNVGLSEMQAGESNVAFSAENRVRIKDLVAEALEKNPEIKFYEAELQAAKAGRRTAGTFPNPELNASAGLKSAREPGSSLSSEGLAWSVGLAQPFEWPGRLGLRKAIANRDIELAQLGVERFKTALAGRVRSLAYSVFAAQEKASVAREVAQRFQDLREVLVQRDPAGLTPLLETRVIEATELNMQRRASEATIAAQAALLELNFLRGAAAQGKLSVAPSNITLQPLEDTGALLARARTNNYDLRIRASELAQQGFRVDLAKNERYPTISVGPTVSEERAGNRERIIGMAVSLPLPLWNRNQGNIAAAEARKVQAETSLFVTQREIERKVTEAALTYQARLEQMAKWRPDSVDHFREAAELADRHYRLGAVPVATYVELQQNYLEAVDGLLDTKREALEAAQSLEQLTGIALPLTNTDVKEEK